MELRWKLIIVVVLLVSLGALFVLEDSFMGNVVWEPSTEVDGCGDVDIRALWDEVFVVDGMVFLLDTYRKTSVDCKEFVVKRQLNDGSVYFLYGNNTYSDNLNQTWVNATWANLTDAAKATLYGLDTFDGVFSFFSGLDEGDLIDWDVADNTTAMAKFQEKISATAPYFIDIPTNTDLFGFLDMTLDMHIPGTSTSLLYEGIVSKNFSKMAIGYYNSSAYTAFESPPTLLENISDYDFEINSSWNTAFTIADHFQLDSDVNVGFSYTGGQSNNGGVLINYTIEPSGDVRFNPAQGYNGSLEFVLSAMGDDGTTDSNYFTVNIVPDINYPPVFIREIDDILLIPNWNVTIYLDDYFADPDGTTLTYSAPEADNISVVFDGDDMYVWLKSSFVDFERFRVVASDGVHQTSSNRITVFLDNSSGGGDDLLGGLLNDSLLVSSGDLSAQGTVENNSEGDEGSKIGFWIMVIAGILLVVLIIGAVVYFAFFDKGPIQAPVVNTSVNDYLRKVRGGGDPGKPPKPASAHTPVKSATVAGIPVQKSAVDAYLKKIKGETI